MDVSSKDDGLASFRLDDRLIVVTGSSEGIGHAFAEAFVRLGALVVMASRRRDKLEAIGRDITAQGGRAEVVPTDITSLADIRALAVSVRALAEDGARRIVLVNNAGFGFTKAALDVTEQDWQTLFATHLGGTFFCAQSLAPLMIERGYGKIINMSSTWAVATDAGKSVYGTAKAAVSYLTKALATEWAASGIRVNALAPTTTMTDSVKGTMSANPKRADRLLRQIKLGRFAQPTDLLGAAIFLASGASDFMTGQTLFVDGGFTS